MPTQSLLSGMNNPTTAQSLCIPERHSGPGGCLGDSPLTRHVVCPRRPRKINPGAPSRPLPEPPHRDRVSPLHLLSEWPGDIRAAGITAVASSRGYRPEMRGVAGEPDRRKDLLW